MKFNKLARRVFILGLVLFTGFLLTVCELPIFPDEYEPNDTYDEASLITLGTIRGTIQPDDDEDYYLVSIADQTLLIVNLTVPAIIQASIDVYSAEDNLLLHHRADNAGDEIADSVTVEQGDHVIRVRAVNYEASATEYTLTLSTSVPVAQGY